MPTRYLLATAFIGNVLVAATTYAVLGWNSASAHAGARNTARFSVLWLAAGLAVPGLSRLLRSLPEEARLIQAFLAAHIVHFASVALVLAVFDRHHVAKHPIETAAVVVVGFSLVVTTGLTATPRPSRLYTAVHTITLYTVFLIFFAAFVHNPYHPLRLGAIPLALALLLRAAGRLHTRTIQVAS
jgi:hypothetical protein